MTQIIHQDQAGFLPKRQLRNNVRTVLNVIEYFEVHSKRQMALVLLDAKKAFDNVSWNFKLEQLLAWQCGEEFYMMVRAIYTKQQAKVLVNGDLSQNIEITKRN